MVPLTYRCPETGQQVQGWAADDLIGWAGPAVVAGGEGASGSAR
jgi:hypothetical protein